MDQTSQLSYQQLVTDYSLSCLHRGSVWWLTRFDIAVYDFAGVHVPKAGHLRWVRNSQTCPAPTGPGPGPGHPKSDMIPGD